VTVIDAPGAALAARAEEGGLSGEIGRTIVALLETDVPTVAVILGQGVGGAALALLACDHLVAAGAGWLSPLPPEGAARSPTATPSFCESLQVRFAARRGR
jgi:acetyl-CoA carboxylase carboxyl transferase subunit beta